MPSAAIIRIAGRVAEGGHDVPAPIVTSPVPSFVAKFLEPLSTACGSMGLARQLRAEPEEIALHSADKLKIVDSQRYNDRVAQTRVP